MKLIRCYVQNYGKLHEFAYDFNDNLNIILQNNGWGKSTFASFIKAMLFGLSSTTKKDLDENERAKYTPWQGGKFGGWLEFSLNGNSYRVERFFGTTQSKDTVVIYDLRTNTALNDSNFIEKTLGINADTFMRSTFIEQGLFSKADDESIKAKLGKLVQSEDIQDLSQVDNKLLEKQTSLQLLRGKGGKIYNLECELNDTLQIIEKCKNAKNQTEILSFQYHENQQKIAEITEKISNLRIKIQQINDQRTAQAVYEHLESLKNDLKKLEHEKEKMLQFFKNEPPSKLQMEEILEWQKEYNSAKLGLENLDINTTSQKIEKLNRYFANSNINEQDLINANNNYQQLKKIEGNLSFSQTILKKSTSKSRFLSTTLSILGGLMIVFAIISAFMPTLPNLVTIIFGVLGGVSLISGLGLYFFNKKHLKNPAKITAENNIQNNNSAYNKIKADLDAFVTQFGESTENLEDALYNIKFNYKTLLELEQDKINFQQVKEDLQKKQQKYHNALVNFYANYFINPDRFNSNYNELQANISRLNIITQSCEDKQNNINNFIKQNGLNEDFKQTEIADIEPIQKQIAELEAQMNDFIDKNITLNTSLNNFSNQADMLGFYQEKEKELQENIKTCKYNLEIIKNTRKFLEMAKNNLTSKYLTPLSDAFKYYAKKFAGIDFNEVSIDTSLNVKITQQGEQKQTKYFSHGIRDIIELCMRLALIRAIFENELPPLILDDPFYNLDDEKTQNGLALLQELSKEFQVIYLVCHSSRA